MHYHVFELPSFFLPFDFLFIKSFHYTSFLASFFYAPVGICPVDFSFLGNLCFILKSVQLRQKCATCSSSLLYNHRGNSAGIFNRQYWQLCLVTAEEEIHPQGEWRFSRFCIQTLQRAGMESASGKTNPGIMNRVYDGQFGFHCRAMNEEMLYSILEWIRGQ
jgi:hypothetical protein